MTKNVSERQAEKEGYKRPPQDLSQAPQIQSNVPCANKKYGSRFAFLSVRAGVDRLETQRCQAVASAELAVTGLSALTASLVMYPFMYVHFF
jgi:hypothetical protein